MKRRDFLTTVAAASLLPQMSGRAMAQTPAAARPERLEARCRLLLPAQVSVRKGHRDDEGLRREIHQLQGFPPAAHGLARRHPRRDCQDPGRGPDADGRRHDHDAQRHAGRDRDAAQGLRVREDCRLPADRRGAEHQVARRRRAARQRVPDQDRDPQPRAGGQVLPVPLRRLQAHQVARQADGAVRRHRPHVARRRRSDQVGPRAERSRLRPSRQGPARPQGPRQPGDRRQGRDRLPGAFPRADQDQLPGARRPRIRDQRRRSAAGHAAVVRLHARRAGRRLRQT